MSDSPFVIESYGLTKRYGPVAAITGLTFEVSRHRITGFLGRNGAGKSTTIKTLLGMVHPTSGNAKVLGHPIDDPRASLELRRRVAYVGEDKGLYSYLTVAELIRFTRAFYSDWRTDLERQLLDLYQLPLKRKVKALSKGMRTKLALLLALARQPALLILDEPSEGLDPVSVDELLHTLAGRSADGTAVFFSSHQLDEVERIADHVLILDRGRLILDTELDEVREHYRRVTLVFTTDVPEAAFRLPGVHAVRARGRQLTVMTDANTDAVVARAHSLDAVSVDVTPVSLREVFLDRVQGGP
jgi:ABC-2 type transport system ATP-binding protein